MILPKRIWVTGHTGLVGSALVRALNGRAEVVTATRAELDLEVTSAHKFIADKRPDAIVHCAAHVGGVQAMGDAGDQYLQRNMSIQDNVFAAAGALSVTSLAFIASCIVYPESERPPINEDRLTGVWSDEPASGYANAKRSGISRCALCADNFGRNFFSVVPCNIYGPTPAGKVRTDVVPMLMRKFHDALPNRPVEVWGTGNARREFLYVDDFAEACIFLLSQPKVEGHINVGMGTSVSIAELVKTIQRVVGHEGEIIWDVSKPQGGLDRTLDISRMKALGWQPRIELEVGLRQVYAHDFLGE